MTFISKVPGSARSDGDPSVVQKSRSARGASDQFVKGLGWFSIALGLTELLRTQQLTRALGVEGHETLVRVMGAREIAAGITCLSTEKVPGVWSRVLGDVADIGVLLLAYRSDNPKRANVGLALAAVAGVTMLDLATAEALTLRHARGRGPFRDYSDRSGWPEGERRSRGAASDFRVPDEYRDVPPAADASQFKNASDDEH